MESNNSGSVDNVGSSAAFNLDLEDQKELHARLKQAVDFRAVNRPDMAYNFFLQADIKLRSKYMPAESRQIDVLLFQLQKKLGGFTYYVRTFNLSWNPEDFFFYSMSVRPRNVVPPEFLVLLDELAVLLDKLHLAIRDVMVRLKLVMISDSSAPYADDAVAEYGA